MAQTKEKLADSIEKAIKKIVGDYVSQQSPEAAAAQKEFDTLENQKQAANKALGADSAAAKAAVKALEKEQKKLDTDDAKGEANNRKHAAWAVVHACNNLKLPVKLKASKAASVGGGGRTNVSKEEREAAIKAILKAVGKTAEGKKSGDIREAVGVDKKVFDSAWVVLIRGDDAQLKNVGGEKIAARWTKG